MATVNQPINGRLINPVNRSIHQLITMPKPGEQLPVNDFLNIGYDWYCQEELPQIELHWCFLLPPFNLCEVVLHFLLS